jgi:predicted nucleic acid-binding protein
MADFDLGSIALFDTGIILRASTTTLDHSDLGIALWQKAKSGEIKACLAQQNVREFFSVLTRCGVSHGKVLAEIQKHLMIFPIITPKEATFARTLAILQKLRWLKGPQIYDLLLAQTALDNGIRTIYTFNDRHFRKFGLPLHTINPAEIDID